MPKKYLPELRFKKHKSYSQTEKNILLLLAMSALFWLFAMTLFYVRSFANWNWWAITSVLLALLWGNVAGTYAYLQGHGVSQHRGLFFWRKPKQTSTNLPYLLILTVLWLAWAAMAWRFFQYFI